MANTFELIASSTVGSGGAADINFASIPSTYTDLSLAFSLRDNSSATVVNNILFTINGTSTGYSERILRGVGPTGVVSSSRSAANIGLVYSATALATSNTFCNGNIYIPNYAGATNKSISIDDVTETNATEAWQIFNAVLWSNTAAITSINLAASGASFVQHSTAYLYGVKNA
jgi:hypothetical protein